MIIKSYGRTERGYIRQRNEDNFLLCSELGLYFVADGLGGHPGGDVASSLAIQWAAEWLCCLDEEWSAEAVMVVLDQVNRELEAFGKANPEYTGLGTTLSGIYLEGSDSSWMIHSGDSRLYGLDPSKRCEQLSTDQTLAMEAVQKGILPMEEAIAHPFWHVLSSCLGSGSFSPQVRHLTDPYAAFFLCTDGLFNAVTFSEIRQEVETAHSEPERLVNHLVDLALKRGGKDNITAIGIYINHDERKPV